MDAGSDGSEEWEIQALLGPVYDIHRLGVFITASPRHADVLLVTGAGSVGMSAPLRTTYDGMPDPKVVIAAGTDAVSGGLLAGSDQVTGGVGTTVPVDIWLAGSPPSPFAILNALLLTWALVLGEYTIAYLLLYSNLQVELYSISRNTPNAGVLFSTSFAALLFAFVLLLILSFVGRRRRGRG